MGKRERVRYDDQESEIRRFFVGREVMKKRVPPKLRKLPAAKQRCLDQLLDKNSEGTITAEERAKLEKLVAEAERVMVANARLLAEFSDREAGGAPAGAVPVTVWVKPAHAGR